MMFFRRLGRAATLATAVAAGCLVAGCAKKSGQEAVPENIATLSISHDTLPVIPDTQTVSYDTLPTAQPKEEPSAPAVERAAGGGNVDMAEKLLNKLYDTYIYKGNRLDFGNKNVTSKYFSVEMVELLYSENRCKTDTGKVCRIDWNILCACQGMPSKFAVGFNTISVKPVMMLVYINYVFPKHTELLFTFTNENGLTKISDIITANRLPFTDEYRPMNIADTTKDGKLSLEWRERVSDTAKYGKLSLKQFLSSPL